MAIIWSDSNGSDSVYGYIMSETSGVLGESFKIDIYMQDNYYCEIHGSLNVDDAVSELIYSGYGGTTVNWTPPISASASITNENAAGYTFYYSIRTKSNGDPLNDGHQSIYFKIPFSPVFVSCDVTDASGHLNTFGKYIQYESQIRIKAKIEIDSLYGVPPEICHAIINNNDKSTTDFVKNDDGTYECTVDTTAYVAGTIPIIINVIDTRGESCSEKLQIDVMSYEYPVVTITNPYRCNANGDAQYNGEYACTTLNSSADKLDGMNELTVILSCIPSSGIGSSTTGTYYGGSSMCIENRKIIYQVGVDEEYILTAKCTDKITSSSSVTRRILRVMPMFDIDRANNSFGFGTFANEKNTARFGPKVMFEQEATFKEKVIFEQGSNLPTYAPNLLDNSDFTNVVNQEIADSDFAFDRWHTDSGTTIEITAGIGITIPSDGLIWQNIPLKNGDIKLLNVDKIFTLAAMTTDGVIYTLSHKPVAGSGTGSSNLGMENINDEILKVTLWSGSYKWVALYEGEYNEGSLPVYYSNGYSEELKRCRRYYQKYECIRGYGVFRDYYANIVFPLDVPMRIIKPTIITTDAYGTIFGMCDLDGANPNVQENTGIYLNAIEGYSTTHYMNLTINFSDIEVSSEERNRAVYLDLYNIVFDATL